MPVLETTGNFMLIDPQTRLVIEAEGQTTVPEMTIFLRARVKSKDLRLIKDGDEADSKPAEAADLPISPTAKAREIEVAPKEINPFDHDGDGKPGGSKVGFDSTAHKGAEKKKKGK